MGVNLTLQADIVVCSVYQTTVRSSINVCFGDIILISNKISLQYINRYKYHFTNLFCKVELDKSIPQQPCFSPYFFSICFHELLELSDVKLDQKLPFWDSTILSVTFWRPLKEVIVCWRREPCLMLITLSMMFYDSCIGTLVHHTRIQQSSRIQKLLMLQGLKEQDLHPLHMFRLEVAPECVWAKNLLD